MPGTRKLGRPTASRMAMLRAMVTFLLEKGRIETTVTRAKEVRSMTEKMITIAKNPTLANKRLVYAFVTKESVSKKLFDEIAPKYMERNGGYLLCYGIITSRRKRKSEISDGWENIEPLRNGQSRSVLRRAALRTALWYNNLRDRRGGTRRTARLRG